MDNQSTVGQSTVGILDEFQTELIEFWPKLPNKAFFFALLAVWLALFQFLGNSVFGYGVTNSLFVWLVGAYSSHDSADSHGFLVPVIVLGLYWWKRKELIEVPPRIWWWGLLITIAGMVLHIAGYLIQQPRVSVLALVIGIYGLMGLAWGPEWLKRSAFPFFLMIFCIPFGTLVEGFTFKLRLMSAQIVEWIAHSVMMLDVVRDGTKLTNPVTQYGYDVAAACSGIRSLVTIGLMATIGAFIFLRQWWRRGVLIAAVVPLAVAGNALRLLSIIIADAIGGHTWGNFIHEGGPLGIISLLPYIPAFFGLLAIGKFLKEPAAAESKPA